MRRLNSGKLAWAVAFGAAALPLFPVGAEPAPYSVLLRLDQPILAIDELNDPIVVTGFPSDYRIDNSGSLWYQATVVGGDKGVWRINPDASTTLIAHLPTLRPLFEGVPGIVPSRIGLYYFDVSSTGRAVIVVNGIPGHSPLVTWSSINGLSRLAVGPQLIGEHATFGYGSRGHVDGLVSATGDFGTGVFNADVPSPSLAPTAYVGQAVPGAEVGHVLASVSSERVNAAGHMLFVAQTEFENEYVGGIFYHDGLALHRIVLFDQPAPGMSGSLLTGLASTSPPSLYLSDQDQVMYDVFLSGPATSSPRAIFAGTPGNIFPVFTWGGPNDVYPGVPGKIFSAKLTHASSGHAAIFFTTRLDSGPSCTAITMRDPSGAFHDVIAVGQGLEFADGRIYGGITPTVWINDLGQVVFVCQFRETPSSPLKFGLFSWDGSSRRLLVKEGDQIELAPGQFKAIFRPVDLLRAARLTNDGRFVCSAQFYDLSYSFLSFDAFVTCPSPAICAADYDQDGGVTGADMAAFFADFESGNACADVDQNGGVDGGDIGAFFVLYEAGGC